VAEQRNWTAHSHTFLTNSALPTLALLVLSHLACLLAALLLQERAASPLQNLFGGTRKVESLATQVRLYMSVTPHLTWFHKQWGCTSALCHVNVKIALRCVCKRCCQHLEQKHSLLQH
jgi:hypothetical protein